MVQVCALFRVHAIHAARADSHQQIFTLLMYNLTTLISYLASLNVE